MQNIGNTTIEDIQKISEMLSRIENPKIVRMDEKIINIEKVLTELKNIINNREDQLIKRIENMISPLAIKNEVDLKFEKYREEIQPIKALANKVNASLISAVVSLLSIIGVIISFIITNI